MLRNRRGSVLLMVFMLMLALAGFASVSLDRVRTSDRTTGTQVDNAQALALAEAGIAKAAYYLLNTAPNGTTDGSWRTTAYPAAAGAGATDPRNETLGSGSYTMWVETSGSDIQITSQGLYGAVSRIIRAKYAYSGAGSTPTAYWKLDETVAGTAADSTGNGYTGTGTGAAGTNNRPQPTTTVAPLSFTNVRAWGFDGTDDYVSVVNGGSLNGVSTGTISLWVRWTGVQDASTAGGRYGCVTGRQKSGGWTNNVISISNSNPASGVLQWSFDSATTQLTGVTAVGDSTWRHVAVTFDGTTQKLYLNGSLESSVALGGSLSSSPPGTVLSLGAWISNGGCYFKGQIDDARVYSTALSASEIAVVYGGAAVGTGSKAMTAVTGSWQEL